MASTYGRYIWHNGSFIRWEDAKVHIMSHAIHYGSSVFEGIRVYQTHLGPAVFRLKEHIQRLINSAKIYRMEPEWNIDQLCNACIETVKKNEFGPCYIRPVIFRGFGEFGVNPLNSPIEIYIASWEWGQYLGPEALEKGVDVCISSWNRFAPNTLPTLSKAGGNYLNSQLIKMEALMHGYSEGIALDRNGLISEGSGENIFIINNGRIITPPVSSAILPGITRDTVFQICKEEGYSLEEKVIPREALYLADEIFFSGTAAEITPVRSVDKIKIGTGKKGKITDHIQKEFFHIFSGKRKIPGEWLTPIK
jgi:branched-chain amino acid aminotransferase